MKKFKRVLALVLTLVLAVSFMPMQSKEVKAGDGEGFYAWYTTATGNTFDESTYVWKAVGTPSVECQNFITVTNTNASKTLGFAFSTDYDSKSGPTSYGTINGVTLGKAALKMGSNAQIDIAPTCDGTVNVYWTPKTNTSGTVLKVNGVSYTEEEGFVATPSIAMQTITFDVVAGENYAITRTAQEARLCLITFTPASSGIEKDGYYNWTWSTSDTTAVPAKVGVTVVSGAEDALTHTDNYIIKANGYADADADGCISLTNNSGDTTKYNAGYKMSNGSGVITFTAPTDGVLELYCRPRYDRNQTDINLMVNDEAYGEAMTLPEGATDYSTMTTFYEYSIDVDKDKVYELEASQSEVCVFEVVFKPNAVSTLGASYRQPTPEHVNGIRFGSTIDKVAIDYSKVTESGTLVALKSKMESAGVTELTMDNVDVVCKKVVRTTYLFEDDSTLNYAAAIVNIPDDQLDTVIVARPYVVIDGVTYYGSYIENSWNGVRAALNN